MGYWFSIDKGKVTETTLKGIDEHLSVASNLKKIRDALEVDTDAIAIDYDDLRSIPDLWTTHRIYDMMLFGPDDAADDKDVLRQYRKAVVKHWRAIMAIHLIGQRYYKLQIETEDITKQSLSNPNNGMDQQTRQFMLAMFDARPQKAVWNDPRVPYNPNIVRVYYVRKSGKLLPIAISSPTTLIVPAADAWKNLYGMVDWIERKVDEAGNETYKIPDNLILKLGYEKAVALQSALLEESAFPLNNLDMRKQQTMQLLLSDYINSSDMRQATHIWRTEALFRKTMYYFTGQIKTTEPNEDDPVLGGVDPACYVIDGDQHEAGDNAYFYYYYIPMPITDLCFNMLKEGTATYRITPNIQDGELKTVLVEISDGENKVQCSYGDAYPLQRIREYEDICSVAVWPKQSVENWSAYYAFRYDTPKTTYFMEPNETVSYYDVINADKSLHRYYRMNAHPKFWSFCEKTNEGPKTLGFVRTRQTVVGGADQQLVYKAALDFGTSSTMLYRNIDGMGRSGVAYGSAFWSAPVCNPERHEQDQIVSCYIPTTPTKPDCMPYQTLLGKVDVQNMMEPGCMMGRWVFFRGLSDEKRARIDFDHDKLEIASNLKWNAVNPADAIHFLEEIILFAALDARLHQCGVFEVCATYPGSMMDAKVTGYLASLNFIMDKVAEETGLRIRRQDANMDSLVSSITESLAVAKGFRSRYGLDFCSVDIGGGTSDIFICYLPGGENAEWQGRGSSLKIGARDIFLDCFWGNRNLIAEILDAGASSKPIQRLREQFLVGNPNKHSMKKALHIQDLTNAQLSRNQVHFLIESLLDYSVSVDGISISAANALKSIATSSNATPIINMRLRIAYYFAAVVYYAGMLARIAGDDGSKLRIERLEIRFAGNGSKALEWISDDTREVRRFIKEMFRAGMQQTDEPKSVEFSERPKHEVAYGALITDAHLSKMAHEDCIIAGERFTGKEQKKLSATDKMPMLASDVRFNPGHEELIAFLDTFNAKIHNIIPAVENAAVYKFPYGAEAGFKNRVDGMTAQVFKMNEGIKSFFLMGVEIIDPMYDVLK